MKNEVAASTPVDLVRSRLEALGRRIEHDRGHEFWAQCVFPDRHAYGDRTPSLHVSTGDAGQVVFYCHAGCTDDMSLRSELIGVLGLQWSDLYVGDWNSWGSGFWGGDKPAQVSQERTVRPKYLSSQAPEFPKGYVKREHPTAIEEAGEKEEREMDWLLRTHAEKKIPEADIDVEGLLPRRPPGHSDREWEVLRFFVLCVALRRWADMPDPYEVRFSRYWVAPWMGLHEQTVKRAIAKLRRPQSALGTVGLLVFVEETKPRRDRNQARGTFVFAPGWLVDAEQLPAASGVVARGPEDREEGAQDFAMFGAEADDGWEAFEDGG